jgi:hypothetical protein
VPGSGTTNIPIRSIVRFAVLLVAFPEGDAILYTSCNEKGPVPTGTVVISGPELAGPPGAKGNELRSTDPLEGATPLVGSKNVVNVALHPVAMKLLVKPLVNSTFRKPEVRSCSVKDTMIVCAPPPPDLTAITSVMNVPGFVTGEPTAPPETETLPIVVAGRLTMPVEPLANMGIDWPNTPPVIVIMFALALEDQSRTPATSTAAVRLNLVIFSS